MFINKLSPHGGDLYSRPGILDFSANINPFGTPEKVRLAMRESLETVCLYPDPYCRSLREKTALSNGVPADAVLLGNGAAELIYQFAYSLPKEKEALIVSPTFGEYEIALHAAGIGVRHCLLDPERGFVPDGAWIGELERIIDRGGNIGAVFLCSPNNPTGVMAPSYLIERIADTGVRVFCDFSFIELSDDRDRYDIPGLIKKYPNLVLSFSFTKSYAIPGVRLGYVVCGDGEFLERMSEKAQCWNVSVIAQAAGIAALDCGEWLERCVSKIRNERERLRAELAGCGLTVYQSSANFLLIRTEKNMAKALLEKGIQVRDCSDYYGLSDKYFRIAVRTKEDDDRLIRVVRSIAKK